MHCINKYIFIALVVLLLSSCKHGTIKHEYIIVENDVVNKSFIDKLDVPERALLSWYLYAYGNECVENSSKVKCQLLKELHIENECDPQHLSMMMQWFSEDMLALYKLNKCPNLSSKSAIQNSFEKIALIKSADTLSIEFIIKGMNNSQEKSWNVAQTHSYLINGNAFVIIKPNE